MNAIEKKSFSAGEVIFRQGEASSELYHILSGRVGIFMPRDGDVLLAELGPGALFGEMAMINGPPRTATATALDRVTVNVVPEAVFRQNTLGLPEWALNLARVMADRLKNTTRSLDKMLHQKALGGPRGARHPTTVNIAPHSLEVAHFPETDVHRLYLSGVLDTEGLERLLGTVNNLRRQRVSPVILSFSGVVDVQRRPMDAVIALAKNSSEAVGRVQLEDVRFIDTPVLRHGFEGIVHPGQTPVRRVGYGEHLIRQGEVGDQMFVVKTGSFTVSRRIRDKEVVLWTAEEGDVIGEMALVSGGPRSASVVARKTSQVYVIDRAEFQSYASKLPKWFLGVIEGLAHRLRETDKKLDEFVVGSFHPVLLSDLMSLEIFENVRRPGACRLSGALTSATLPELKGYVRHRLKHGVRHFAWDVTPVQALDQDAMRFLVGFHRYLPSIRGTLRVTGSRSVPFPGDI